MTDHDVSEVSRRGFLETGARVAATAVAAGTASVGQAAPEPARTRVLPRRALGKTGVDVTILNPGTWQSPGTDRLLRFAYANGVRYFDTADCDGSEPAIARSLRAMPEVRKEVFLATKDHPTTPCELFPLRDRRLASLQTD